MAIPAYFRFPGISSETKDPRRADWIELSAVELTVDRNSQPNARRDMRISKPLESATPRLFEALTGKKRFPTVVIEFERPSRRGGGEVYASLTLEDVVIERREVFMPSRSSQDSHTRSDDGEQGERLTLSFARQRLEHEDAANAVDDAWATSATTGTRAAFQQEAPAAKKPAPRAVTRANATAATEHSTINLRPPKFFELALPILTGENGKRIYPPATATLRLTSQRGYNRSYDVSDGMITDDQYCSFRFYDISEKAIDELFTATLESGGETELIFKDRRVATYIQAARKTGRYETTFAEPPVGQAQPPPRDELLAPAAGSEPS